MKVHPILKCRLLCFPMSSTVEGGRVMTKKWYLYKHSKRMKMEYSLAVNALTTYIIYN